MKRSAIARGKPLERGTKGLTRTPLARGTSQMARTEMKRTAPTSPAKPARRTGASASVHVVVDARDGGRCQRCGAPGTNRQHREGRGTGGRGKADAARTNGPAWLVTLCGMGNTSGCHQAVDLDRARAEREGFVIRRNGPVVDAATVPVKAYDGWVLLDADGGRTPCPAPA